MAPPCSRLRGKRLLHGCSWLLGLYAVAWILVQCGLWYVRPRLETMLSQAMHAPVTLRSVRLTPAFQVRFQDIRTPLATATDVRLTLRPRWTTPQGFELIACTIETLRLADDAHALGATWTGLRGGSGSVTIGPRLRVRVADLRWRALRGQDIVVRNSPKQLTSDGRLALDDSMPLPQELSTIIFAGQSPALHYTLRARTTSDGIAIDGLQVTAATWQTFATGVLTTAGTPGLSLELSGTDAAPRQSLWSAQRRRVYHATAEPTAQALRYIAGSLRLTAAALEMPQLTLLVGHLPLMLQGTVTWPAPSTWDIRARIVSHPERAQPVSAAEPLMFDIAAAGRAMPHSFAGSVRATAHLWAEAPVIGTIACEDCAIRWNAPTPAALTLAARHLQFARIGRDAAGRPVTAPAMELDDVQAALRLLPHTVELTALTGRFADGTVQAHGHASLPTAAATMPRAHFQLALERIDAARLLAMSGLRYPSALLVDGEAIFEATSTGWTLTGQARTEGSVLEGGALLRETGRFLGLNLPERLPVRQASTRFALTPQQCLLTDINVESEQVRLRGEQRLDCEGRLDGWLALSVSRQLTDTSWKLRLLLALLGHREDALSFEFDVGGLTTAPQLRWRQSVFRDGIARLLPHGKEARIEADVERALAALQPAR